MTTNIDLAEFAKHYKLDLLPPISKDELDTMTPMIKCYIINLENSGVGMGSHWGALYIRLNQACYFDSFGAPCPTNVTKFIKKRTGCKMVYSRFIVQDFKSQNCGLFALACCLYLANHKTNDLFFNFNNFINGFTDDTKLNDKLLESFYNQCSINPPKLLKSLLSQNKI